MMRIVRSHSCAIHTVSIAALLSSLWLPSSAIAQMAKLQQLDNRYVGDTRLMAVFSQGPQPKRCVGITVGSFAILTSYHCLADWWDHKDRYTVRWATDAKRQVFVGNFRTAHRGQDDSWAILETDGHSSGYFGYLDIDNAPELSGRTVDFIGFSRKVKGGRELAVQARCQLNRTAAGLYTSECGGDFDQSGIVLVSQNAQNQPLVSGLASVQAKAKVAKRTVYTLRVTSVRQFGAKLAQLRQDQDNRYAASVAERNAEVARLRAEQPPAGRDWKAERDARARKAAQRQEDLERLNEAARKLGTALGGGRTEPTERPTSPAPPSHTPRPAPAASARPSYGSARWQPSSRVTLPVGQVVQVRAITRDGAEAGYINMTLSPFQQSQFSSTAQISVFIGNTTDPSSNCTLTIDGVVYLDGRSTGFFWGKDTLPMQTTKGAKQLSPGTTPRLVEVELGGAPITCR